MTSPRTPRQWNAGDPEPGPEVQLLRFQRDLPHPYLRRSLASDDGGLGGWALETHPDPATWSKSLARTWGHRTEQTDLWGPLVEVLPETPEPPQVCSAKTSWATADDIRVCALPDGHEGPHRQDPAAGTLMWWQGDDPEAAELPGPVPASQSVPAVPVSSTGGKETGEAAETATEALRDTLAALVDPDVWAAREDDQDTVGAQWQHTDRRRLSLAAAERILAAGWRPPLADTLSPWDAYREAYDAFRRDTPSWRAHFTAHHMHALEAALRVYDPCAEHGDLLRRYVAASLEFDYTAEGDCGGEYDTDEEEHEAALANIAEMHRLLNVRAERLAEAHEKLRAASSPLPDSETETEHVIEFREDGWTIMHPLACRPNLFACAVNRAAGHALQEPPAEFGRFACGLAEDGQFVVGDRRGVTS